MTNKMQLCRIIYYSLAALHISRNIFAHNQEHLNCITASDITHVCRCQPAATYVCNIRRSWNILILLASCQQTCMTYTIAVCTVKNSWWWIEEPSETCRFSFVHLVGFIMRNLLRCTVTWTSNSYKTSMTFHTSAQYIIPEDLCLQQGRCQTRS
jgi:hypothetical protein